MKLYCSNLDQNIASYLSVTVEIDPDLQSELIHEAESLDTNFCLQLKEHVSLG